MFLRSYGEKNLRPFSDFFLVEIQNSGPNILFSKKRYVLSQNFIKIGGGQFFEVPTLTIGGVDSWENRIPSNVMKFWELSWISMVFNGLPLFFEISFLKWYLN